MIGGFNLRKKLKIAFVVSLIAVLIGALFDKPHLWFAIAVLISTIVSLIISKKVVCDDLGRAQTTSIFLNYLLTITMFFALYGWIVCIGLMVWWIL